MNNVYNVIVMKENDIVSLESFESLVEAKRKFQGALKKFEEDSEILNVPLLKSSDEEIETIVGKNDFDTDGTYSVYIRESELIRDISPNQSVIDFDTNEIKLNGDSFWIFMPLNDEKNSGVALHIFKDGNKIFTNRYDYDNNNIDLIIDIKELYEEKGIIISDKIESSIIDSIGDKLSKEDIKRAIDSLNKNNANTKDIER